jgi:hypothetical protein
MIQVKKSNYLKVSISLSIISIALSLLINIIIAKEYLRVDGKTRALFGIKELYQFGYQYYVVILGIVSLIIAILSIRGNNQRGKVLTAILLSLFALIAVFARMWRLFV